MPCSITSRDHASAHTLNAIRAALNKNWILETSKIDIDLGFDPLAARATLYPPVRDKIIEQGCSDEKFNPDSVQGAKNVGDIVTAVWDAVK